MSLLQERLDEPLIREVLQTALSGGADFAELYAEHRRGRSLRLEDRRIEELTSSLDIGAGIRVSRGATTAYAYTNVLDRGALLEAARVAAAGARGPAGREVADLTRPQRRVEHPVRIDPFEADKQRLVELATRADTAARDLSADVRQVVATHLDATTDVLIANSEGRLVDDRRTRTRFAVQVIAARDGVVQTGFDGPGATAGHELFDAHPPEDVAGRAAGQAVAMLDSRPAPSGEMPVVLWRGDGGVLFHEACGHGLEADIVAKEASVYAGKRGERIGSDLLSGVDDATVQNGWGSFAFDDEGTPAQRTVLFDAGVLTDYMTDRKSSRRLGLTATGNGRRQSYAHLPIPRMTNSYILPGSGDPEEVIAGLDHGVLCKGLGGGQVNPATGDFVFGMTEAYLVEGGEVRHALRGANLVGNGPETLRRIDAVCSDFAQKQGICGKDGQGAPVAFGTPTLRIARITVGGTA
ncbi:MAG TPA: TldD/PmbA family protein [Nitriliruptorales bacterium]|nr:TldD/PmbA family protein [Nitriliruptorales bacterium]